MTVKRTKPTIDDAIDARALLEDLLAEFPFVNKIARAVALSGMITPIARGAFGTTPMHIARAPTPASGKSFLWDIVASMTIGHPMPVIAAGRTEEETEKRLGAALMAGRPLISIDNVNGELGGDALCQLIERPLVDVRVLGKSENVRIEARGTSTFATGNNIIVVADLTRRVLTSTLDAEIERQTCGPSSAIRSRLCSPIAASTSPPTICRAYLVAGRPKKAKRPASFGDWSEHVSCGSRTDCGSAAPIAIDGMEIARAEDPELTKLRAVLQALHGFYEGEHVTLAKVIEDANTKGNDSCRNTPSFTTPSTPSPDIAARRTCTSWATG